MQQPSASLSNPPPVLQQRVHYQSPPPNINLSTRARRRSRTTPDQVAILENFFHTVTSKPSRDVCRDELAPQVNISPDSVYFWFQNRRSKMSREQRRRGRSESPPRRRTRRSSTSAITPSSTSLSRRNVEDYTRDITFSRSPITTEVSSQLQQLRLQRDESQQRPQMTYYTSTPQTSTNTFAANTESSTFSTSSTGVSNNPSSSHHQLNVSSSSYGNTPTTSGTPPSYAISHQQQYTRLPPLSSFISSSTSNSGNAPATYSGPGSAFTPTAAASVTAPSSSNTSSYQPTGHSYQQQSQQQQRQGQGRESQEPTMATTSTMGPTTTTTFSTMGPVSVYNIRMPGTSEIPPIPFYFHHTEYGTEASMLHYLHNLEQQQQHTEQHHQREQQEKQSTPPSQPETP